MSPKNDVEMGLSYTVINTNKSFQKVQYGDYTLRNKCQYSELFWSAFPTFGLNMEGYGVSLCIQSECRKMRTRITSNTDTFHVVIIILLKCFT